MIVRPIYAASLAVVSLTALAASRGDELKPMLAEYLSPDGYYFDFGSMDDDADVQPSEPADATPIEQTAPPEQVAPVEEAAPATPAAAPQQTVVEPPINVTITPEDRDALITRDVMATISNDERLSGKIGVETYRQVVRLTGRVSTPGQVDHAGNDARSVSDVSEVQNLIRARVGG